uniref:ETS domain-containing protein n=1 Tax=Strongyloides papillosus TaxID=174720 RepID=A0A0N5BL13_STREA
MSYNNQASFCGNYSPIDDQYPNNGSYNHPQTYKNYDYCYDSGNSNSYQNISQTYCIPPQINIQSCSYGYENTSYSNPPEVFTNQQSPINVGYHNFNDYCYGNLSTPSSNSSSSFVSQGTPEYSSFTSSTSDNMSFTNYCDYPNYNDNCGGPPQPPQTSNVQNPISNFECHDPLVPSISNPSDYQNYQNTSNNFECSQNDQFSTQGGGEFSRDNYTLNQAFPSGNGYSITQNFQQLDTYSQNQGLNIQEGNQNYPDDSYQNTISNQEVVEDPNIIPPTDYQTTLKRPLTVEISNFILTNINSIFLNFTIRLLSSPKYQRICFWSKVSWEFIIADPMAFTKVFAEEYDLNKKYMTFSHVSKAYKIVEASTIYGQHIITRVKSKRNTWRFFPEHNKMGFPCLKNAGGASLAGTILNAEEMKFLTKLKKKLAKLPSNQGTPSKDWKILI